MKTRYAAALALVGLYLMLPPSVTMRTLGVFISPQYEEFLGW
jgi:hypothetical protein